ncbi:helix-turn-helix transcriptional regulator [Novosphingobium sp. THN1]|uniref:helix-turn-helix domain-containing protein n=1 Tax=Novosphingobium sp. THN1 TaxID=1016987 RepID=UPI001F07E302|nr:helix-turn-helix transcriptional regulator [Novosphingobium sp. THN1]
MHRAFTFLDDREQSGFITAMIVTGELCENPLVELTAKQREVLDLLIQHMTSKEISRQLGISPHTVDQRIMLARAKLGVATRGEVAQAYRRLVETYEQPVYEDSHIGFPPLPVENSSRDDIDVGPSGAEARLPVQDAPGIEGRADAPVERRRQAPAEADGMVYHHVLPEMFDGPNGTLLRLGYIGGITVFLILIVLGGLSMFMQLSTMLDQ